MTDIEREAREIVAAYVRPSMRDLAETAIATALRRARAETDAEAMVLRSALERHHDWHLQSGTIGLPDGEGGWIEMDNAAEYGDSSLYEQTVAALSSTPRAKAVAAVMEQVERAQDRLALYERVHVELDDGKAWEKIDNGMREGAKPITYDEWRAYITQSLISILRSIVLARQALARLTDSAPVPSPARGTP